MSARVAQAGELFDYAVAHPDGFTKDEVVVDLGWSIDTVGKNIRTLRLILGDDTINLVCTPNGERKRWVYQLTGRLEDAKTWAANRLGDCEARLETIEAIAHTIVTATDGRSTEGRRAKLIFETVHYLRTQLDGIDGRLV